MADTSLSPPDPLAFDNFVRAQAKARHANDRPPVTRKEWLERRAKLRTAMFEAMGPVPDKSCPLAPKVVGV